MTGRSGGQDRTTSQLRGFDDYDVSLGDMLRGERATLGKSLLDVQRELKIKATYIDAIENASTDAFETPGFVAGYVRSYARYLGLNPDEIFARFCAESGFRTPGGMGAGGQTARGKSRADPITAKSPDPFANPSISFVPKAERGWRIEPGALGSVAVLLMLVTGLGYGGWTVLSEIQKVEFTQIDQAPGVASDVAELDGDSVAPMTAADGAGDEGGEAIAAADPQPTLEAYERLYRPQALDVPVLTARDAPIATLDPRRIGTLIAEPGESVARASEPAAALPGSRTRRDTQTVDWRLAEAVRQVERATLADQVAGVQVTEPATPEVRVFAVRPAWVRIRAADGSILFEKILETGEEFTVPLDDDPATLRAGNAGSVYFAVNGKTYGPAGAPGSVVKDVALAPDPLTGQFAVARPEDDADLARYAEAQAAEQATPPAN